MQLLFCPKYINIIKRYYLLTFYKAPQKFYKSYCFTCLKNYNYFKKDHYMRLSEVLEKLETLKNEYNNIASNYEIIYYDDIPTHFGSDMWMEVFVLELEEDSLAIVQEDYKKVSKIVEEALEIFKENNLQQFLFEGDPSYWLGILPEPYSSLY